MDFEGSPVSPASNRKDFLELPASADHERLATKTSSKRPTAQHVDHFYKSAVLGTTLSISFLLLASQSPSGSALNRYFLGHPIAITATILFWFAVAILTRKYFWLLRQRRQCEAIRNADLTPNLQFDTPAEKWHAEKNVTRFATNWAESLNSLPPHITKTKLLSRLSEVLHRQSQRGSARLLADDLRELSNRDADAAHDSYGLVRIISWAIPMLGFLGTVIGITQTLGGLDFTNGNAAVENLKSGLYVAFDTTAVGLVLSVLAIFIQFPIERIEQNFLAIVDDRVGDLVSSNLPNEEHSDQPTKLISNLLDGIQTAIAESLSQQAKLWQKTISEAQQHWRDTQADHAHQIRETLQEVLTPAISLHAEQSSLTVDRFNQGLERHAERLDLNLQNQNTTATQYLDASHGEVLKQINLTLNHLAEQQNKAVHTTLVKLEDLQDNWLSNLPEPDANPISTDRDSLGSTMLSMNEQTQSLLALQKTLDANLQQIHSTNVEIQQQMSGELSQTLTDAMKYLARTVDQLSTKLGTDNSRQRDSRTAA